MMTNLNAKLEGGGEGWGNFPQLQLATPWS